MARPRKFDESEVISKAKDQFWTNGFAATTIDDLSNATGLGKGSLYGAFGDKHQLFRRVFDDYCTIAVDGVRAQLQKSTGPAYERLRGHVLGEAAASATASRGCLMAKATAELAGEDETVAARAKEAFDRYEFLLVDAIAQAQCEGDIDSRADPAPLAALLLTVLRGFEPLHRAGKDANFLKSAAEAALASLPPGPSRDEL